jgi:putative ABC transport system ATP-binding protein
MPRQDAEDAPLVRLEQASRSFDDGRIVALQAVDLAVGHAELVAVHGPSGSGKSTLFNLMAGLDRPSTGTVSFDGRSTPTRAEWASLRRQRIGLVFQEFNLLPTLTAVENIEVAMFGMVRRATERRRRALDQLAAMGMADCANRLPQQLAGGERRRVGVARALVNSPALLLADEPTANLDSANGAMVAQLLLELHRDHGMALVIITHDPWLIAQCPRCIRLLDGRATEDAAPATMAVA